VQVIVNPAAAGGRLGREWASLEARLESLGLTCEVRFSEAPGHATEIAGELAASGARRVLAAGGDGTLTEVAEGLGKVGVNCELAVLPLGTGNDGARTLGLPNDLEAAAKVAQDGVPREVDLIRVGERLVLNAIGIGLTADINERATRIKERVKGMRGITLYLVAALASLFRYAPPPVRLVIDDESMDTTMTIVAVHNGPTSGGGFALTPGAVPDDGLLDILLVPDVSIPARLMRLYGALRGTVHTMAGSSTYRTRAFELHHTEPMAVHLDGNAGVIGGPISRFEIVPKALKVIVPG